MHDIDRTQTEFGTMETFEFAEAGVFNENEELELAAELLEISTEAELDRFLGDLISKAGQAVGQFVGSPTGQALGGLLKGAARKVLPMAGQAIGGYLGGSTGAQIGGRLASAASNLFEGEGISGEDRELDAAKGFIRLAGDAVKNAAAAPPGVNPRQIATAALTQAAQIHAPGLIATPSAAASGAMGAPAGAEQRAGRSQSGRWIRRGSKIVLYGI
jgi:uncharacterized protein (DUF697 family)